ncbi:hypothetical protein AB4Y85_04110 [Microvirga sp. 2YAF29]|uniref:hypothetical protein n=1 Tax=Microvirga sp. 2YAF29 TaxID=3233031 RepID=UPI003F952F1D
MIYALTMRSCSATLAVLLGLSPMALAANASPNSSDPLQESVQVRFDARMGQTRVVGPAAPESCFALSLPQEWRSQTGGLDTRLKAVFSDAELEVSLRSTHELRGLPQPDLVSRDAALLQQDYESLLGRPAQSVSLASLSTGATRWSATWVDHHLPSGPQGMTVETLIVPLSSDWVLELSLTNVTEKSRYEALMKAMLTSLKVQRGPACAA